MEPYYPFKNGSVEDFTIGSENCDNKIGYCNGPLKSGSTYRVKVRAFTAPDKFTDTSYSFPIQTGENDRAKSCLSADNRLDRSWQTLLNSPRNGDASRSPRDSQQSSWDFFLPFFFLFLSSSLLFLRFEFALIIPSFRFNCGCRKLAKYMPRYFVYMSVQGLLLAGKMAEITSFYLRILIIRMTVEVFCN